LIAEIVKQQMKQTFSGLHLSCHCWELRLISNTNNNQRAADEKLAILNSLKQHSFPMA
jgi:hypothetical protein